MTDTSGPVLYICYFGTQAVAWTLSDLAGRDSPSRDDVTTALSFRQAGVA
jgi:hypothetical protein